MVILAAGASRRMEKIKQLLPWKNTTLLEHAIQEGLASEIDAVFVVLGANAEQISNSISHLPVQTVINANWERGMGTSIACAMQEIHNYSENFDAVLIALTDQPLLEKIYFNNLINSYLNNNKNIIASQIKNGAGVPVILSAGYFEALANLDQDFGARKIIANHPEDVILVNPGDKIVDVDTKEAYEALFDTYGKVTK